MKLTKVQARNSFFAICSLLLPLHTAGAASIWTTGGSAYGASQYRQPNQPGYCTYNGGASNGCSYVNNSGFLPYNSTNGQIWTSTVASYSATLQSSGDANGLHALAAISITDDPLDFQHYWMSDPGDGGAYATWQDSFVVNGTGAAYLQFLFAIDGTLSATSHARADATVAWSASVQNVQASSRNWTFSTLSALGPPIPSTPLAAPSFLVHGGDTVTFSLQLGAKAAVGCQMFSTPMLCTASASADLSNTLAFSSIAFQDGLGNNVSGFSLSSANFDYNGFNPLQGGGSVPEPGAAVLAGTGLLLALAGARAARRKSRVQ